MKKLINDFKMLRYGLQIRQLLICGILFIGMGTIFECFGKGFSFSLSGFYFGVVGAYAYQISFSTINSKWVKSSPLQRRLLTTTPVLVSLVTSLAGYTLFVLMRVFITIGIRYKHDPRFFGIEDEYELYIGIIYAATILSIAFIYQAFCYRYYVASTVVFTASVGLWLHGVDNMFGGAVLTEKLNCLEAQIGSFGTHGLVILTSYLLILLSAIICYAVNILLYRIPLSPVAFRFALKQAGK